VAAASQVGATGLLDLAVGPESLDRALRILDTFLKSIEAAGFTGRS